MNFYYFFNKDLIRLSSRTGTFLSVLVIPWMVSGQTLTLSADVPSNSDGAYFDATFEITLNQSTTGQLYLDVSEKGGVQSIEILNDYEFNSSDALPPGSDIYYNGGGTSTINSTNWLASAAKNAYSGEDLKLKIRVYPNQSGNVHLYYRAAFIFNTSEVRTPSSSAYTDQQGWFCQRSTTFNAPEVLPNVKIKNIAVNGGEDIYQGEEVQIEVTLEETNGADAGRVDVYYLVNNHEIDDSDDVSDELFANDSDKEKNPHTFLQSGQNEVKIILDIDDKIAEDDESDNEDIISVNVINVAPSTTITDGPTNGSIIEISDVTFSWSGTDPGGENVGYEVKFNDGGQSTNNTTLAFTAIEGKNTFEVRAVDNDGAYSDWVTRIFTYEEIPSSQGLIAYYPFNGNTYDESGNENHGVGNIGVAYTIDRYGKANSAASFDGAIGNVDFGNLSLAGSEISVLAWVYLENLPATFGAIVSKDEDYEILVNNEGSILFPINNQNLTAFSPTKLETGKWYLVAGTHDGNTSKIYINGQEDLSTQNSASIGNGGKFLGIGSRVFSDGRTSFFLDGKIDDVRLYNYALSSNQTDSLFQDRPTEDPNKELIAYYTFNGNTLDKSGNGNNANAYGLALTKDRFGEENKAYFFDGVDDFMSVPHNESLNLSEEFTLSTWILSSNPDTQQEILVKGSGASNHQYQMYLTNSDNWLRSSIGDISNRTSSDVSQPQDEWIHAVTTCDGSVLKTFANGELISSLNINYSTIQSNSYDLLIGKGNNFFGGSIDDIRIYNYSLTDLEVDDLYQQEKPTEDNTNFQPIQIGQLIIEAEQITETTTNVFSATGNVNIGNKLFFDGELIVNRNDLTLSGNGRIYTKDIPQIGVLDLYDGEFSFEVEASAEKITSTILDKANQQFDLFNLPIHIEGISFLEDGIEINGQIVFPEVLDGVTAEIDQIKLTKSQGLDVVGMIDLHNKIKIHGAVTLSELLFQFDMDQNQFRGLGIIETALFDASTGVYIVEEGLDSVGVWVDVANPQPLGTTGLALAGAGGYVDGIQIPPLTIGLGTTLVIIGTPPEFLAFERLLLEYEFGTRMKGSGNFVLFGQALANAYFEIDKKRVALGVDVNFQDILIAYMKAAIMANDKNGIDFIGKFGGELQIPNGEGFEFEVLEQLLREALKDPTLTLPYSIAGSDNIIVNNKLRGRAWIVRPGRKDFKASYLIKFKNGKVTTKFIPGFRLYNEDVFSSPNARLQLEYLNEVHPESRFEGKSLVLRGSSDNSSSQTLSDEAITQDFIISTDIETIIVRVKGETSLPSFEISDPNGLVISSSSDFQNYQYMTNNEKNASFIIADLPIKGTYTISIVDEGDNYLVDVIGNEGDPGFMINEINQNDDVINIQWTDDNPFDDAEISFYLDEDKEGANGTPIELSISEDDETDNVEYEMTDELPGTYYIYGIMSDTLGNNVVSYYEEPITITTSLAAPTNLEFSLVDDALYLEWEKSVDCQNCDYLIFLDDSDQISTTSQNQNVGDTSNFTLTNLQFGQTYFITMAAQNDEGNLTSFSNTIEVELISTLVNNLPTVKSVSFPQQLTKGEHTTITFDLYDADSDILTLQAIKAPDNISISSNSIGWEASTIGLKQFVIGVYDQEGIGDSVQFFIEVFNEVLFSPSISTNKNQLEAYGESLVVSLRNPALINDNSQINLNAYTISNPDEVLALNLKSQDTKIGLFNGSISLDRDSNLAAAILQSSRTDTLVLSYSFDNSEIQYRIAFNGPNTPPENLSISNLTIDENQEDELIGRLSAFDFDEDLLEFSLANDIEQFKVSGDSLLTDLELNYEKKGEYDLQILVSDGTDEIASSFSITVNDINDAPTDILLSQDSIYENSEPGSLIGILSSEDEDENESFTYSFENSSDLFEIVSDKLLSKVVFDHEAQTNYNLEIKVVDKGSLSFLKSFNILIVDVDEPLGISNESKITVYPNPVSDILIIKSNSFKNATIYDLSGQEILRSNNKVIDMQSLIEGTYILRVVSDDPQAAAIRIHKK